MTFVFHCVTLIAKVVIYMEEYPVISFRERIRLNLLAAMKSANISQVQLAERLGISKGTVNNWAKGNNSPDVDMVPQICRVLEIPVSSLYTPLPFEPEEICSTEKKSTFPSEDGLRKQEDTVMNLVSRLSPDQQEFLLAWLKTTIELKQRNRSSPKE